jgi:NADH-quinone oxidoreductase subunit A
MQAAWACELPHIEAIFIVSERWSTGPDQALRPPGGGPHSHWRLKWKERGTVNAYAPILVLGGLAAGFAIFSVFMASLTGPKRYNRAKLEAYECGIEPTPQPAGGGRFPIKYYLTAMLFIVFDIEIVFLYPWAVTFDRLGMFGLVEMLLFVLTVFVAYAYVWRRGGLEWD